MKTAMQILLEDIEFEMPKTYNALNRKFDLKKFYLKKESNQIIEAFESGLNSMAFKTDDYKHGIKYYDKTFLKPTPERTTTNETSYEPNV